MRKLFEFGMLDFFPDEKAESQSQNALSTIYDKKVRYVVGFSIDFR